MCAGPSKSGRNSVLGNLRAGFPELCVSCLQYLEMRQLSPSLPHSSSEGLPVSSQDWVDRQSVLEPLAKLRNAQSSLGQKRTKLFCVWAWWRRESAVILALLGWHQEQSST